MLFVTHDATTRASLHAINYCANLCNIYAQEQNTIGSGLEMVQMVQLCFAYSRLPVGA